MFSVENHVFGGVRIWVQDVNKAPNNYCCLTNDKDQGDEGHPLRGHHREGSQDVINYIRQLNQVRLT
jgi:hypothetical protein